MLYGHVVVGCWLDVEVVFNDALVRWAPERIEEDQAKALSLLAWNTSSIWAFVFSGSLIPIWKTHWSWSSSTMKVLMPPCTLAFRALWL